TIEEASLDAENGLAGFGEDFGFLLNSPKESKDRIGQLSISPDSDGQSMKAALDQVARRIMLAMEEEIDSRVPKKWDRTPGRLSEEVVLSRNLLELGLSADRKVEHLVRYFYGELFWGMIHDQKHKGLYDLIGIDLTDRAPKSISRSKYTGRPAIQVHSVRMANRLGDRGQVEQEYVVELVQSRSGYFDPNDQLAADSGDVEKERDFIARSGATLLIDARSFQIRRVIRTNGIVSDDQVLHRHRDYRKRSMLEPTNAFDGVIKRAEGVKKFTALHRQKMEKVQL
ncbi:MAG: hypothetical protein ABJP82_20795, partial [Hyphomicrobiales bacterium]